jgi:hypothetical protein
MVTLDTDKGLPLADGYGVASAPASATNCDGGSPGARGRVTGA